MQSHEKNEVKCLEIMSKKNNCVVKLIEIDGKEYIAKYYYKICQYMIIELNIIANCQHENIIKLHDLKLIQIEKSNNLSNSAIYFIDKIPCLDIDINIDINIDNCMEKNMEIDNPQTNNPRANTDNETICMILPKGHSDMHDIVTNGYYNTITAFDYLIQIAKGLKYLHDNQILHLDLKLENIVIIDNLCKIIDFGSSDFLFSNAIYDKYPRCTADHCPPEGFLNEDFDIYMYTKQFDVWSFGILMFEILNKKSFSNFIYNHIQKSLSDKVIYEFIRSHYFLNKVIKMPSVVQSCLKYHYMDRPSINVVVDQLVLLKESYISKLCLSTDNGSKNLLIVPAISNIDPLVTVSTDNMYIAMSINEQSIQNKNIQKNLPMSDMIKTNFGKYYVSLIQNFSSIDPNHKKSYPSPIIKSTIKLGYFLSTIYKLNKMFKPDKLNEIDKTHETDEVDKTDETDETNELPSCYFNYIIKLCWFFSISDCDVPFKNIVPSHQTDNIYNQYICNKILLISKGKLFWID